MTISTAEWVAAVAFTTGVGTLGGVLIERWRVGGTRDLRRALSDVRHARRIADRAGR